MAHHTKRTLFRQPPRAPTAVGIKASGGIRTAQHVLEVLKAGADLVGTSAGVEIVEEFSESNGERYS